MGGRKSVVNGRRGGGGGEGAGWGEEECGEWEERRNAGLLNRIVLRWFDPQEWKPAGQKERALLMYLFDCGEVRNAWLGGREGGREGAREKGKLW